MSAPINEHTDVQPLLQLIQLGFSYGTRVVLSDLTLSVSPGEVVGILGRNGSGKSTAIAMVAGLLPCPRGQVIVDGRTIVKPDRRLRSELGVVFQSPAIDDRLSCLENLELAASLHGMPSAVARPRIQEQLALADLADRAKELAGTLSGGLKRRLDLARALLHRPRLLLMDEPTSGLDEAAFRATWDRLNDMRVSSQVSVLVATHRSDEAERCDRIAILDGGTIVELDSPNRLRERISDDLIVLSGPEPETVLGLVQTEHGLSCHHVGDQVFVECDRGHEWVPKLVERIGAERLTAVELRRPSLADVFLKITGHALTEEGGQQT
jgi:ABC-2 type transport system ATP-binding protein